MKNSSLLSIHFGPGLKSFALGLAVFLAMTLGANAAVVWKTNRIEVNTTSVENSVVVDFPFTVKGKAPVHIVSVDSGCSCTAVRDVSAAYAPGEDHRLTFDYSIGGRVGTQEREIQVVTDDQPDKPHRLKLIVHIEEMVKVAPRLLVWRIGEEPVEKSVTITLSRPADSKVFSPPPPNDAFAVRLEPADQSGLLRVVVKPKDTRENRNVTLPVPVRVGERQQSITVFLAVR